MNRLSCITLAVLVLTVPGSFGHVLADDVEQGPKDSPPSGLFAGVARADITPPVGIAQMNWGSQSHIHSEGNDPLGLCATALVLSDGETKFAMAATIFR